MPDLQRDDLADAIDNSFDAVADQVFDDALVAQLEKTNDPAVFRVTSERLKAATEAALNEAPPQVRMAAFMASTPHRSYYASEGSGGVATLDREKVLDEADDEKKRSAAEGIRKYLCGELKTWFEENLEQVKKWLEELGIKGTLKKMWGVAKQLVMAGVTAIAGVVGSMFLAYFLIAVAVAAVGAAIYFIVKKGVPNYCEI
jgi:hypothetical protein